MGAIENNNNQGNREGLIRNIPEMNPNEIRKESFFTCLKQILYPKFKFTNSIFILSVSDLIIYIITISFGIKITPTELLAPKFETLDLFGMKYPIKIYRGQIHRLLFFAFLHANCVHLIANLISQVILGSFFEELIGSKKAGILYILSSIFGGLFSCVMNNAPGVGASVAIFGILGGIFGFTIINWEQLKNNFNFLINIFIFALIIGNAFYSLNSDIIDNYGHLGGLIYGFLFIFILVEPITGNNASSLWFSFDSWKKYIIFILCGLTFSLIFIFWIIQKH